MGAEFYRYDARLLQVDRRWQFHAYEDLDDHRNAGGYFYFCDGEAADWLDRTVSVPKVSSLNLEQWMEEFIKLKIRNAEILSAGKGKPGRSKK